MLLGVERSESNYLTSESAGMEEGKKEYVGERVDR